MVIKITKQVSDPRHRIYRGECRNCKTEVTCLESDGILSRGTQREPGDMVQITCPTCHHSMYCY